MRVNPRRQGVGIRAQVFYVLELRTGLAEFELAVQMQFTEVFYRCLNHAVFISCFGYWTFCCGCLWEIWVESVLWEGLGCFDTSLKLWGLVFAGSFG